MSDTIVLTIPTDPRFRPVATLVLGGIGSRLELPYERMDDLQLAVLSALGVSDGEEVTLEVEAGDHRVAVSVGPVADGSGSDRALMLVLDRLVDSVKTGRRDGSEWLTLELEPSQSRVD